jgi:hypothetical protein
MTSSNRFVRTTGESQIPAMATTLSLNLGTSLVRALVMQISASACLSTEGLTTVPRGCPIDWSSRPVGTRTSGST